MKRELDCRGLQCPEPVTRCRNLVLQDSPDELAVLVDNAAALENVSRFLERQGFVIKTTQPEEALWRIIAIRSGTVPAGDEKPDMETSSGKTLVLVTTETLGRGDDELGARLMGTFLASLSELGPSLWRIILLNGGVKLAARDGEALKQLQKLEAAGVSILVCGTCLMHYGLMEQKKVGETTNMMDVVTSMALADKVIRP